ESIGDAACIRGIRGTAATLLVRLDVHNGQRPRRRGASRLLGRSRAHEEPHHLVALLPQQVRRGGTVHTAAHRQYNAHLRRFAFPFAAPVRPARPKTSSVPNSVTDRPWGRS